MTTLIIGPNNSGKSSRAEDLITRFKNLPLYYIATMIPYGEEGRTRILKHQTQRQTKGFITVERPFFVSGAQLQKGAAVLLEDASNLLANAMFERGQNEDDVFTDITNLCAKCRETVIVTIGGLCEKPEYDGATSGYIAALNRLNEKLACFADETVGIEREQPNGKRGHIYAPPFVRGTG